MADILKLVDDMEKETRAIKADLLKMVWYMRGGVTLEEIYQLDRMDREEISKLISENLETTKTSGLPFF